MKRAVLLPLLALAGCNAPEPPPSRAAVAYADSVVASDVRTDTAGDMVGARGTLRNVGSRTVDRVEGTLFFLDAEGQTIAEASSWATWSDEVAQPPLRPGYSVEFRAIVTTRPPAWDSARFEVTRAE